MHFISSHPRGSDPGEPLDICTTTFTKPLPGGFFGDPATKEQKQSNRPHPGLKNGDQSSQIPHHACVCSRGHPLIRYSRALLLPEHKVFDSPLSCAIPSTCHACFHVYPVLLMSFSNSRHQVFRGFLLFL